VDVRGFFNPGRPLYGSKFAVMLPEKTVLKNPAPSSTSLALWCREW
jgi:hypothetical protein